MTTTINLETLHLDKGSHNNRPPDDPTDGGVCLMEAVAWFVGEPHSEAPKCVSPYLRRFGIRLNDLATDEQRQDLIRFIPLVVGTAGDGLDELRTWMGADHAIRVAVPKWFDRAGLTEHAERLRALPRITDRATYDAAWPAVRAARDAAYQAQRDRFGGKTRYEFMRDAVKAKLAEQGKAAAAAAAAVEAAVDAAAAVAAAAAVDAAAAAAAAAAVDAAAAAAAAVDAAAAVAAAVDAAAAVAAAAAVDAAAAAAAAVDAAAAAEAAAAVDAAAAVEAAVDAAAVKYGTKGYWEMRDAAYKAARAVYEERYADLIAESWDDAVALFGRLIKPEAA